jgi:hypothetical protein
MSRVEGSGPVRSQVPAQAASGGELPAAHAAPAGDLTQVTGGDIGRNVWEAVSGELFPSSSAAAGAPPKAERLLSITTGTGEVLVGQYYEHVKGVTFNPDMEAIVDANCACSEESIDAVKYPAKPGLGVITSFLGLDGSYHVQYGVFDGENSKIGPDGKLSYYLRQARSDEIARIKKTNAADSKQRLGQAVIGGALTLGLGLLDVPVSAVGALKPGLARGVPSALNRTRQLSTLNVAQPRLPTEPQAMETAPLVPARQGMPSASAEAASFAAPDAEGFKPNPRELVGFRTSAGKPMDGVLRIKQAGPSGKSEAPVATLIADPRIIKWGRFSPEWFEKNPGYVPTSVDLFANWPREMSLKDVLATRTLPGPLGVVLPEARGFTGAFPHTGEWNDLMRRVYELSEKWGDEFVSVGYRTDTLLYSGYRSAAGFSFPPTQRLRFFAHTHPDKDWEPSAADISTLSKLQKYRLVKSSELPGYIKWGPGDKDYTIFFPDGAYYSPGVPTSQIPSRIVPREILGKYLPARDIPRGRDLSEYDFLE